MSAARSRVATPAKVTPIMVRAGAGAVGSTTAQGTPGSNTVQFVLQVQQQPQQQV